MPRVKHGDVVRAKESGVIYIVLKVRENASDKYKAKWVGVSLKGHIEAGNENGKANHYQGWDDDNMWEVIGNVLPVFDLLEKHYRAT